MSATHDQVVAGWTRLGAGFNAAPAEHTPDLEQLLLDTARRIPESPRLLIMAATWLHLYGELVARRRLQSLIRTQLSVDQQAVMGLLLTSSDNKRFDAIVKSIRPRAVAGPLYLMDVDAAPAMRKRAERRSSEMGKRWGLWSEPFEFKLNAMRSWAWIVHLNPMLLTRVDLKGDLRAGVLASLGAESAAGRSEMALARAAGGSRPQVRAAIRNLELSGKIERVKSADGRRWEIRLAKSTGAKQ